MANNKLISISVVFTALWAASVPVNAVAASKPRSPDIVTALAKAIANHDNHDLSIIAKDAARIGIDADYDFKCDEYGCELLSSKPLQASSSYLMGTYAMSPDAIIKPTNGFSMKEFNSQYEMVYNGGEAVSPIVLKLAATKALAARKPLAAKNITQALKPARQRACRISPSVCQ